ncbi:MAG: hypothetical protein ACI93R_002509 [Flavobacteriales bacterium]|jgi:hypothetical protein
MALKKDKQKVLGETFDDERVRTFLEISPRDGWNSDFLRLERAYRSMKADNFATFIGFFAESGFDINATDPKGRNLLQQVVSHRNGNSYAQALRSAGARS